MLWPSEVLPTPGGPTKHRIGLLPCGLELAHRQVLEDAPLDLLEPVVVLVEDAPRLGDVDRVLAQLRPRQLDQPVEVGAQHRVLGRGLGHALQALELLARLLLGLLGHAGLGDRLLQLLDLAAVPSASPSSFWIACSCSRRKYSRWRPSTASFVCWPMSRESLSTSMRCSSSSRTLSSRARRSNVSRISCFSSGLQIHEARDQVGGLRGRCSPPARR